MLSGLTDISAPFLAFFTADDVMALLTKAGSLLAVLLGFSFVVFVHELGHFMAAKWAKVKVEKFCIGFGKELFGFTRGETRYGFNALPLGGYVKMLGQEDFAVDKTGELVVKAEEGSFTSKTIGQRMVIVSAGVIMNLILAAVGMTIYMMIGYATSPSEVGIVVPGTPAARAGIEPGDVIREIDGEPVREFSEISQLVALSDPGATLDFLIERNGRRLHVGMVPEFSNTENIRQVGMSGAWTRRAIGSIDSIDEENTAPTELRRGDLIVAVVTPDGEKPVENLADIFENLKLARGEDVALVVDRPTGEFEVEDPRELENDNLPSERVNVVTRLGWFMHPEEGEDPATASLLGLQPRVQVGNPVPDGAADKAGIKPLDSLVRIGDINNPSVEQIKTLIRDSEDRALDVVVRRVNGENKGLSAAAIRLLADHREQWIDQAIRDGVEAALSELTALVSRSDLTPAARETVIAQAGKCTDAASFQQWLDGVDLVELSVKPQRPFAMFSKQEPTIGLPIRQTDDGRVVVAGIRETVAGRKSPAVEAAIPAGAIIVSAGGRPIRHWAELTNAMRANAGGNMPLRYRIGTEYTDVSLPVPQSIETALSIPANARIISIDGKTRAEITKKADVKVTVALPDWRAAAALLNESVGKSVEVKWLRDDSADELSGTFAVTAENADPWTMRIGYQPRFVLYPKFVTIRETDILMAMKYGIQKTYLATWNTLQSIRHIAFTRQVGVDKLSGPLGIARVGMSIAEADWAQLLFFMCFISANLAVINFLPLPIVDGGLFLFLVLEKLRGEPLSIKTQAYTQVIGIILIASLFLFVTFQDIMNWNKL